VSEDFEPGKAKFLELVKSIDAAVEVVIPVTPSRGSFLISLTKGKVRKFISVNEDDIIDLTQDAEILRKVTEEVQSAIASFSTA
jgi:hypothetical protein